MSEESRPDVRLGEMDFRLAGMIGWERMGMPPLREMVRPLGSSRNAEVAGNPAVENVYPDDLRWSLTSFAGGEGQVVLNPDDLLSIRRYDRSVGIDLSQPGQIRLGRRIAQAALDTGTALNTIEGSTFSDLVGESTVSGTDRIIDDEAGEIQIDQAVAAGPHQVNLHGYVQNTKTIQASVFTVLQGKDIIINDDAGNPTDRRIKMGGDPVGAVLSPKREPGAGDVDVTAVIRGHLKGGSSGAAVAELKLQIRDEKNDKTIKETRFTIWKDHGQYTNWYRRTLKFTAEAGVKYRYRLALIGEEGAAADGVDFDLTEEKKLGSCLARLSVYDGATLLAASTFAVAGIMETANLGSLVFSVPTGITVTFRIRRVAGSTSGIDLVADKIEWSDTITAADAYAADLGMGQQVWLIDHDAANPAGIFRWDPVTRTWTAVANIGVNGSRALAMAHSEAYEYILLDNRQVYRADNATAPAYTAVLADAVGMTVAADRVWVLTESVAGGTKLWEYPLDETAGLPLANPGAAVYTPVARGVVPDEGILRRMAPTAAGPVFFVNQATECVVHLWNVGEVVGERLTSIAGFRGRGIFHGGGRTYLIGELPTTGGGLTPTMFVIEPDGTPTEVGLPFRRLDDPDTYLQDVQLYGRNVYALAHVASEPPTMRLWRVSLTEPSGLFLEHEVTLAEGKKARAMAVSTSTVVLAAEQGGPFVATRDFVADGSAFLRSSLFNFRQLERKKLLWLLLDGDLPAGTSVDLAFSTDGGKTFEVAGSWDEPGRRLIAGLETIPVFHHLALEIRPKGQVDKTPTVYQVDAVAAPTGGDGGAIEEFMELLILCNDESAVDHLSGQQRKGYEATDYLLSLARSAGLVELVDYHSEAGGERSYTVEIVDAQRFSLKRGESLMRMRARIR